MFVNVHAIQKNKYSCVSKNIYNFFKNVYTILKYSRYWTNVYDILENVRVYEKYVVLLLEINYTMQKNVLGVLKRCF